MYDSVIEIGRNIFYDCASLKVIHYSGSNEQWDEISKADNDFTEIKVEYDYTNVESVLGDVNIDGKINAQDALMILKYSAKIIEFEEQELLLSDVNSDDVVNAQDALVILKYAAILIDIW